MVELTTVGTTERSRWNGNWFSTPGPWEISSNSAFLSLVWQCWTASPSWTVFSPDLKEREREQIGHRLGWGASLNFTRDRGGVAARVCRSSAEWSFLTVFKLPFLSLIEVLTGDMRRGPSYSGSYHPGVFSKCVHSWIWRKCSINYTKGNQSVGLCLTVFFSLLFDPPILYFINFFLFYKLVFTLIWYQFLTRGKIK